MASRNIFPIRLSTAASFLTGPRVFATRSYTRTWQLFVSHYNISSRNLSVMDVHPRKWGFWKLFLCVVDTDICYRYNLRFLTKKFIFASFARKVFTRSIGVDKWLTKTTVQFIRRFSCIRLCSSFCDAFELEHVESSLNVNVCFLTIILRNKFNGRFRLLRRNGDNRDNTSSYTSDSILNKQFCNWKITRLKIALTLHNLVTRNSVQKFNHCEGRKIERHKKE